MKADVDDYLKVPYFDTDYLNNLNICISFSVYFPLWVWFLCLYSGVNTLLTFWLMSIVNPFNCIWTIFADGPTRFLISEWTEAEIAPSTQWGCFCWYPLQCTTDQFSCALCRNAGILEFWTVLRLVFCFLEFHFCLMLRRLNLLNSVIFGILLWFVVDIYYQFVLLFPFI